MHSIVQVEERGSRFFHMVAVIGLSVLIAGAMITGAVIAFQAMIDLIVSNLPSR